MEKLSIEDFNIEDVVKELDFAKAFNDSKIDLLHQYERPPLALSIGVDDRDYNGVHYPLRYGTYGNISLIKGEEKARKSFLKSLLLACAIGGKANNYTDDIQITGHDLQDKYIIDVDTEQDTYDVWLNATRIPKMVGTIPPNYVSLKWREYTSTERLQLLEWLFNESEYKDKLGIVSLDGYVDFLKDFNSLEESTQFTQKLMKFTTQSKCHLTGVLHLNPDSTKARGHLGTILQQKCETVTIIKDMGDYSKVYCQSSRGKRFNDFNIRVDNNWLPYISDESENKIM
jgi:hypothetical protein